MSHLAPVLLVVPALLVACGARQGYADGPCSPWFPVHLSGTRTMNGPFSTQDTEPDEHWLGEVRPGAYRVEDWLSAETYRCEDGDVVLIERGHETKEPDLPLWVEGECTGACVVMSANPRIGWDFDCTCGEATAPRAAFHIGSDQGVEPVIAGEFQSLEVEYLDFDLQKHVRPRILYGLGVGAIRTSGGSSLTEYDLTP